MNKKVDMKGKLYFFYPSKTVGGAQLLFVRLASYLAGKKSYRVVVVDYEDGFLRDQLKAQQNISFAVYLPGKKIELPSGTVLLTPLSNLADVALHFSYDPQHQINFIFWSIQPQNLYAALNYMGRKAFFRRNKILPVFRKLAEDKSILFMDNPNYWGAKEVLKEDFTLHYLPIPLNVNNVRASVRARDEKAINIAWLGRFSYEKIYSIFNIADRILDWKKISDREIVFHVIGSGEENGRLIEYLDRLNISYKLPGVLLGKELEQYLTTEIDLGVAMGTSALEFASRKIPCLLLDYSYSEIRDNIKYRWVFEADGYALGQEVKLPNTRSHTFEEVISVIADPIKWQQIADDCFKYVMENHEMTKIGQQLLDYTRDVELLNTSAARLGLLNEQLNSGLYRHFYRPIYLGLLYVKRKIFK